MKILETLPCGYWPLSGTDYRDYSGRSTIASFVGINSATAKTGIGLCSFTDYSQNVNTNRSYNYTAPVYQNNLKRQNFSVGATVYPISSNAFRIFSRASTNDGLYFDGKSIQFATKYATAGEARCSYTPLVMEKFDVVGVHTQSRNSLYVNGALVSEVDITAAQQADQYTNNSSNFVSSSDNGEFLINAVFATPLPLDAAKVRELYDFANDRHEDEVPAAYDGQTFNVSCDYRFPYINLEFDAFEEWNLGQVSSAQIVPNQVIASFYNNLTVAGNWQYSLPLSKNGTGTFVDNISLDWQGSNVTFETSFNGGAWTAAVKREKLTNVPNNVTMTNQTLQIRAVFASGQTEAYLSRLSVRAFATNSLIQSWTRSITLNNVVSMNNYQPMRLRADNGARVVGSIIFNADPATTATNPMTVEFWMKKEGSIAHNLTGITGTFVNGVTSSGVNENVSNGEWVLVHYTLSAPQTTFQLTGPVQIGTVTFYETALTAAQVSSIYYDYTGKNKSVVPDSNTLSVSELSAQPKTYAYDWSVSNS